MTALPLKRITHWQSPGYAGRSGMAMPRQCIFWASAIAMGEACQVIQGKVLPSNLKRQKGVLLKHSFPSASASAGGKAHQLTCARRSGGISRPPSAPTTMLLTTLDTSMKLAAGLEPTSGRQNFGTLV